MQKTIGIKNLHLSCIIGCPGWERFERQRLVLDLELVIAPSANWVEEDLDKTHCYGQIQRLTSFILENGRFHLLENAAQFLASFFLLPPAASSLRPAVEEVFVRLTKPDILPGQTEVVVSLRLRSDEVKFLSEKFDWGLLETVAKNEHLQLLRLLLKPGKKIPALKLQEGFSGMDHVFEGDGRERPLVITRLIVSER